MFQLLIFLRVLLQLHSLSKINLIDIKKAFDQLLFKDFDQHLLDFDWDKAIPPFNIPPIILQLLLNLLGFSFLLALQLLI